MKKYLVLFLSAVLLLTSGCNFKVDRDTFRLPRDEVESLAIQVAYSAEGSSAVSYRQKKITESADLDTWTRLIREIPLRRITSGEPNPITEFSMIIVIDGVREHRLVLNEDIAFYDQVAYEYTKKSTYQKFLNLYKELDYPEEETEPNRFKD